MTCGIVSFAALTSLGSCFLLPGGDELEPLVSGLVQIENAVLNHFFMQMVSLILILFAALIAYRFISVRFIPK